MTRSRVGVLTAALLLAMGPTLSSCSAKITPEGAAKAVTDLVSEQTDFTPEDVSCPDGVEAKVGVTFDCEFAGPGGDYIAHMKIVKIEGEQVLFDINTELKS